MCENSSNNSNNSDDNTINTSNHINKQYYFPWQTTATKKTPVLFACSSQVATAVRLLGAVRSGDWSEFHRILGQSPADIEGTEGTGAGGAVLLVGDEAMDSPFAIRLRCLCHRMLLPIRIHTVRALNKAYMKREKVPLVRGCKGPRYVLLYEGPGSRCKVTVFL